MEKEINYPEVIGTSAVEYARESDSRMDTFIDGPSDSSYDEKNVIQFPGSENTFLRNRRYPGKQIVDDLREGSIAGSVHMNPSRKERLISALAISCTGIFFVVVAIVLTL